MGRAPGRFAARFFTRKPVPPSQMNAKVPPALEAVILKALEKDCSLRYQHAADIRADLQRLKRDTESGKSNGGAEPERSEDNSASLVRASAIWMILATAFVVLASVGVGIYKYRSRPLLPANGRAPLYVAEFTNSTDDAVFDDVLRAIVAAELDRSPAVQVVDPFCRRSCGILAERGKKPGRTFHSGTRQADVRRRKRGGFSPMEKSSRREMVICSISPCGNATQAALWPNSTARLGKKTT